MTNGVSWSHLFYKFSPATLMIQFKTQCWIAGAAHQPDHHHHHNSSPLYLPDHFCKIVSPVAVELKFFAHSEGCFNIICDIDVVGWQLCFNSVQ